MSGLTFSAPKRPESCWSCSHSRAEPLAMSWFLFMPCKTSDLTSFAGEATCKKQHEAWHIFFAPNQMHISHIPQITTVEAWKNWGVLLSWHWRWGESKLDLVAKPSLFIVFITKSVSIHPKVHQVYHPESLSHCNPTASKNSRWNNQVTCVVCAAAIACFAAKSLSAFAVSGVPKASSNPRMKKLEKARDSFCTSWDQRQTCVLPIEKDAICFECFSFRHSPHRASQSKLGTQLPCSSCRGACGALEVGAGSAAHAAGWECWEMGLAKMRSPSRKWGLSGLKQKYTFTTPKDVLSFEGVHLETLCLLEAMAPLVAP